MQWHEGSPDGPLCTLLWVNLFVVEALHLLCLFHSNVCQQLGEGLVLQSWLLTLQPCLLTR